MKYLVVDMPDGSQWAVPVSLIARSRAEHYRGEFGGDIDRSLAEDTMPLFERDDYEIRDWARGEMDWVDVAASARLVQTPAPTDDYEDGWVNGEAEVRDLDETDFLS